MRNFLVITDNLNAPPWHSSLVVLLDIPAWYSCLIFLPDTPARTAGQTLGRHGLHCSTRGIRNKIKYRKINQMAARSMSGQQKIPWIIKGFTELLTGIGPVTSALPMRRSTDWATAAFILFRSREPCIYYHEGRNLSTINFKKFLLNLINLKRTQTMLLHYCHIRRDNQVSGLWICMAPSAFRASTMEETLSWGIYNSFDTWYVVGVYPCLFVNSFI